MSEQLERMLAEAIETKRPVLVNPTEEDIRRAAEELRLNGKLICTACRRPILEESFISRRIAFGPRLEAVAHLHRGCEAEFTAALEDRSDGTPDQ